MIDATGLDLLHSQGWKTGDVQELRDVREQCSSLLERILAFFYHEAFAKHSRVPLSRAGMIRPLLQQHKFHVRM